jgi:hypothetical protein
MPKKISQIKPPNNTPQKVASSQPLIGATCRAVNTAMPMLVNTMIMLPFRIEIHGLGGGKNVFDLDFLSAFIFFLFATAGSRENLMFIFGEIFS